MLIAGLVLAGEFERMRPMLDALTSRLRVIGLRATGTRDTGITSAIRSLWGSQEKRWLTRAEKLTEDRCCRWLYPAPLQGRDGALDPV